MPKPELRSVAKAVLKNNDHGHFTIPAEGLYPHQWLWDSCFIAIGLRHENVERAQTELRSILRDQWTNNMIPHMVFNDSLQYSSDRNIWRSQLSVYAPDDVATTGFTQPPVLAEAVLQIGLKLGTAERRTWYQTMLPSLIAYHEWMYADRDPKGSGLVLQLHPYETGLDSTPPWIDQLHRHHRPWWIRFLIETRLINAVSLFRRDTHHVPPGQRMSNTDALLYYDVLHSLRSKRYDTARILRKPKLVMQDLTFNSIFIRANECLQEIAKAVEFDLPDDLVRNIERSRLTLEQLWDGYSKQYYSRNFITNKLVRVSSIATLMPLYAGCISKERAGQLVALLHDSRQFDTPYPVASVPISSKQFQEHRYWQGPSWLNTNWLIIQGLERYGYKKEADRIRNTSLAMVEEHGCYEYFSPLTGSPAGAKNFSWTAALALDLLDSVAD